MPARIPAADLGAMPGRLDKENPGDLGSRGTGRIPAALAVRAEETWVSASSRREADFQRLLQVFNTELPLLLTAQSPKGARGSDWSLRIVRWQEGSASVRGIEVRCAPWLFSEFGEHLEGRNDLVFYRLHPPGGKPALSIRGRKAIFVRPPYERHRGFLPN
jgi:hypothetical protein